MSSCELAPINTNSDLYDLIYDQDLYHTVNDMSDNIVPDLSAITLNATDNPPPRTLRLEEMFTRVERWGEARRAARIDDTPTAASTRPSSPAHGIRQPFPLPLPHDADGPSSLSRIVEYPELLPLILRHFEQPKELAILCRVNSDFRYLAQKKLYERVWLRPWEEGCRLKVSNLPCLAHT